MSRVDPDYILPFILMAAVVFLAVIVVPTRMFFLMTDGYTSDVKVVDTRGKTCHGWDVENDGIEGSRFYVCGRNSTFYITDGSMPNLNKETRQ